MIVHGNGVSWQGMLPVFTVNCIVTT